MVGGGGEEWERVDIEDMAVLCQTGSGPDAAEAPAGLSGPPPPPPPPPPVCRQFSKPFLDFQSVFF